MKIIVGLGNPGKDYEQTRHNVGFEVVEKLADTLGIQFAQSKKTFSEVAKLGNHYLLCKPQTFMNESGKAVRAVLDYYSIEKTADGYPDLYVVHDDLDLSLGTVKTQFGTGPKGHNGLLSIYDHLQTEQFWHLRVGIDNRGDLRNSIVPSEYVLKPFLSEEQPKIEAAVSKAIAYLAE